MTTLTPPSPAAAPTGAPAGAGTPATPAPRRARAHLANDAWESTMAAYASLMRTFAGEDLWAEVSMREYDVLYTLSKNPDPQRLSVLGRHVLLSQPALSRLVDRLVERGLVARCADPTDARASHLSLTREGLELQQRIGRRHGAHVARTLSSALSVEELALLETLTLKLSQEDPS